MTIKGLKILSLNVRSLYSNLSELHVRFKDFDILCFCESWLNSSITDQMILMEGFNLFRLDREKGNITTKKGKPKRGGGLVIYIKDGLSDSAEIVEELSSISGNVEQLWVKIEKPNTRKQLIANIYRPPNGKLADAIAEMTDSMKKAQNSFASEITLLGDFNVNYKLRHTLPFKQLKEFERNFNLTQLINTTTRFGAKAKTKTKSCLDLIFTNMEHIISSGVLDIAISDHLPVFLIKKKAKVPSCSIPTRARSYVNYDKTTYQNSIKLHPNWETFWQIEENKPEKMWDTISDIIRQKADEQCPFKNMSFREDTPEWITKEIISEINHKDYLYRKVKKTNCAADWDLFKGKKNEVKKLLASAKENYVKGKLNELEGNPRKFWREINKISGLGKNKSKRKCTKVVDEDGKAYERSDAANFLNNYYVNVGPNLAKGHSKDWDKENCRIEVKSSFNFKWITVKEVERLVKDICIAKSSAIEELSTRLLKDAFEVICFELAYMYNSCLQQSIFPKLWGSSTVTPIPKTNKNSSDPKDWRPISQIALPGKILEKIIHSQITFYLDVNNILSDNQYGFRKERSTSLAIFDVLKNLHENWNENAFSGCVFIDFSRAFDSIDHSILVEKLKLYGFDENSLKFMQNYMSNRVQRTTVNGHISSPAKVSYGTAQGSILGPLIFILYVNDVFKSLNTDVSIYMYADDTLLVSKSDTVLGTARKAQKAFDEMISWCDENKLTINREKTKYMLIKHTKVACESQISMGGFKLGTVHSYEYLGMLLDDKLSMNDYLDSMWKKANVKIGILAKIRRFISEKTAMKIYKCMIRPHLDYIDFVVESGSADRIQKLDRLQKKAIRRIEYCMVPEKRQKSDLLLEKYKIECLHLRRKRNLVKIMYSQSSCSQNLKVDRVKINLRSKKKIHMKKDFTSKTKILNSPLYRGIKLWDSLPGVLQKEKDFRSFKKRLLTHTFK